MTLVAALMLAASTTCAVPRAEATAQLGLDYATFDALGGAHGWRVLNGAGCTDEAVRLLQDYAAGNADRLAPAQRRELAFHAGQALAFAGRDAEAITHFERAQDAAAPADWRAYVAATLAFLRRDAAVAAAAPPMPRSRPTRCACGSSTASSRARPRRTWMPRTAGCERRASRRVQPRYQEAYA